MPRENRKSLSILTVLYNRLKSKWKKEYPNENITLTQYVTDYIQMNLDKEDMFRSPSISKIGLHDNILYLKDEKKNKLVEIRYQKGRLVSSDDDPIYLQYAMALPELSRLKKKD